MRKRSRGMVLLEELESRVLLSANAVIDLLAVYTPQSLAAAGSTANILAKINANVAATNTAMTNSEIPLTIRLAAATEINYTESGSFDTDLDRIDNPTDGYMDNVAGLRTFFGADVVALFDSQSDGIDDGISFEYDPSSSDPGLDAFAVINQAGPDSEDLLAHELGHILGAAHAVGDPGGSGAVPYGHGYRFTGTDGVLYHDIMAYDPGTQIPYYSNPDITYAGVPLGNATTADASRAITTFAPTVAAYTAAPMVVGNLDSATSSVISGWAYDPKAAATADGVRIDIDGATRATLTAGASRSDLLTYLGTANHGFSYSPTGLGAGPHTVTVYGIDSSTGAAVLIGSKIITVSTPIGVIDAASTSMVSGWAIDQKSSTTSIHVSAAIDGRTVVVANASLSRPDLVSAFGSANHGFQLTLPTLSPGIHRLDVYANDSITNVATLLGTREIDTSTVPIGSLDVASGSMLAGWAFSADLGAGAAEIRYSIDGGAPVIVAANQTRTDLAGYLGSADHGFSIALPQLTAGQHLLRVDAVDPLNDAITSLGSRVITVADPAGNHLPVGSLDVASNGAVSGWALDTDSPGQAISVRVDVDGVPGTTIVAGNLRSDLIGFYGSGNHGFSVPMSLSAGAHRIDLYAIDSTSGTAVLIARRNTVTAIPIGVVDVLAQGNITGWTYAATLAGGSAQVRIDVDGMLGTPVTANLSRPDLASLGGTALGFSLATANIGAGTHTLHVWAIDPITDDAVLIGAKTIVFT